MEFHDTDLLDRLEAASPEDLDTLPFGVIGIDADGRVGVFNRWEEEASGLARNWVMGRDFFNDVGICMNNYMVAQRFEDETALDAMVDYVLTFRMKPTPVRLRLLQRPGGGYRWIVLTRTDAATEAA